MDRSAYTHGFMEEFPEHEATERIGIVADTIGMLIGFRIPQQAHGLDGRGAEYDLIGMDLTALPRGEIQILDPGRTRTILAQKTRCNRVVTNGQTPRRLNSVATRFGPASSIRTVSPCSVSSCAATAPEAPEPTTIASYFI